MHSLNTSFTNESQSFLSGCAAKHESLTSRSPDLSPIRFMKRYYNCILGHEAQPQDLQNGGNTNDGNKQFQSFDLVLDGLRPTWYVETLVLK